MKISFISNQEVVLKGEPVDTKLIHPDIIQQLKMIGWDGSTVHIYYDTLYFINVNGKVFKGVEKIYKD